MTQYLNIVSMNQVAPIHFVDEGYPRDIIATHLTIDRSGLTLNTRNSTQDQDGTIKHTQGALDLYSKVDVSCVILQVKLSAFRLGRSADLGYR
jgi:hypothetical protein